MFHPSSAGPRRPTRRTLALAVTVSALAAAIGALLAGSASAGAVWTVTTDVGVDGRTGTWSDPPAHSKRTARVSGTDAGGGPTAGVAVPSPSPTPSPAPPPSTSPSVAPPMSPPIPSESAPKPESTALPE